MHSKVHVGTALPLQDVHGALKKVVLFRSVHALYRLMSVPWSVSVTFVLFEGNVTMSAYL